MKEGLDQRGKTTADVRLHADRTPAGEPASRGATYASDIRCIAAPGCTDFDLDPRTYI